MYSSGVVSFYVGGAEGITKDISLHHLFIDRIIDFISWPGDVPQKSIFFAQVKESALVGTSFP